MDRERREGRGGGGREHEISKQQKEARVGLVKKETQIGIIV